MNANLEVEMAADGAGVAGLADGADPLARIDGVATADQGRMGHVGVEVAAALPHAVDEQVVAVEDRVVAAAQDLAATHRNQRGAASGDDVKALMRAAAAAGSAELADGAAGPVGAGDREDVVVVRGATVGDRTGRGWGGKSREEEKG
jgi:hypothetical protein